MILMAGITAGMLAAQAAPAKSPAGETAASADGLPSEATVNSFLQQTFGYQADLSWNIASIKPSVGGLAEVNVVLASPQGQQLSRFYVTSDGQHALTGDIIPFGTKPFDPVKNELLKGVTGPAAWSRKIRRFT